VKPYYADDWLRIFQGDCRDVLRTLEDASVDAIVTDPPYDLTSVSRNGSRRINNPDTPAGRTGRGFMGKHWDGTGVAFDPELWAELLRVAKPGAHLLAFGGTRTYHRMTVAIEDAGWEIRDCLVWAYASGFPKSLDVSKALDKRAGHWRGRAGAVVRDEQPAKGTEYERTPKGDPVTAAAAAAAGWGTALKPAWEPIVMARKPFRGSVADVWLEHGTGALNIDGARIPLPDDAARTPALVADTAALFGRGAAMGGNGSPLGRWPANVVLTDPIFDGDMPGVEGGGQADVGKMHSFHRNGPQRSVFGKDALAGYQVSETYGDAGTYSRFFLVPKAARHERNAGVDHDEQPMLWSSGEQSPGTFQSPNTNRAARNNHPTVKPLALMDHLVRLVTPKGGLVLDPFLGSGTTAVAALAQGKRCIGIEREQEYVGIAMGRLRLLRRDVAPEPRYGGGPGDPLAVAPGSTEGAA